MNFIKRSLFIVILLGNILVARAQSENEIGAWYIYNGFFNISEKFELFVESQYRSYNSISDPEAFMFRPYLNYNVTKQFQVGIGLEYHDSWDYLNDTDAQTEYRLTLQSMLFQKVGRVKLQHRYRYEFRNIEDASAQRFRYRIQATVPLNNKDFKQGTVFINTFNEVLVDSQPNLALSQNRIYAGLGYQINTSANIQLGYLGIARSDSYRNRFQVFFTHKLDLFKK